MAARKKKTTRKKVAKKSVKKKATRKKVYRTKTLARKKQKKGMSLRKVKGGYVLFRRKK